MTNPELTPLALKPAPLTLTLEMVTFELPLLVSVTFCEMPVPSVSTPKLMLVGLAPRRWVAETPLPLNEIASGEVGPLLTKDTDPLTLPAEVGVNMALNVAVAPTAIVVGAVKPLIVKPVPETLACEIVKLAVPVFFRLMV